MNTPNEFRWGRALKHAGLAFLACLVVGFLALVAFGAADSGKFGEGVGRMSCWAFLFALAASWGKQTGRAFALVGGSIASGIFVLLPALIPLLVGASTPHVLLPEEKAEFERVDGLFCQRALDWGIDDPGPGFVPEPEAQKTLLDGLQKEKVVGHAWAWLDEGNGQLLMAQMLMAKVDRNEFIAFSKSLRKGLAADPGTKIGDETLETSDEPFRYEVDFEHANGAAFDMICQSSPPGHKVRGIGCITSAAGDHEVLRAERESAKFGGCS